MNTIPAAPYKGHRFPQEIMSQAVWLYFRFSLSYRDVEELLAERGIIVTYETVRQWCLKFGQQYANQLRRRRAQPSDQCRANARVRPAQRCQQTRHPRSLHYTGIRGNLIVERGVGRRPEVVPDQWAAR